MLAKNKLKPVAIHLVKPALAKEICRALTGTLSNWFAIPEANARYEQGMLERISFAASIEEEYVGLITLEFPFLNNANIYWLGVHEAYHHKKIGTKLLRTAENYCREKGCSTLTAETISPTQHNEHYLKTFSFYQKLGFKPLLEKFTYDPENLMVYLQKTISFADFEFIDLTHALAADVPHWGVDVGFKYNARFIQSPESTSDVKFRVQRLEMSAGIGTHLDAPSHCFETGAAIDAIPLQSLITTCCVINVAEKVHDRYSITENDIQLYEAEYGTIPANACVLLYTGWDKRWKQPGKYRNEKIFPNISVEAAKILLARNIAGIGIDTLSPDAFGSDFPIHQLFLGAGKYIIENVANADQMDPAGSYIFALPMKIADGTEAPLRIIGMKRKLL